MALVKISCNTKAQTIYTFDNGVVLSCIWGLGSYTENSMVRDFKKEDYESTTLEIYSMGDNPNDIVEWLDAQFGGNPAGGVPVGFLMAILERADK